MTKLTDLATIVASDTAALSPFDRMIAAHELTQTAQDHAQSLARLVLRIGDHSVTDVARALQMDTTTAKKFVGWEQLQLDLTH